MTQGDITFFPSQVFCITVSKIFIGNFPLFQKTSGSENKVWMRVRYNVSPTKFFCLILPKNFIANFSLFQKNFLSSKTFQGMAGEISFSSNNFFCLAFSKNLKGNSSLFQKNSGGENFYGWDNGISRFFFVDTFLSYFIENFPWKIFGLSKNFWQR